MLAKQLNSYVNDGMLKEYSIFKVKKYLCTWLNNFEGGSCLLKVIIVLDLEILQEGSEVGEKVGSPIAMSSDGTVPNQTDDQNRAPNVPSSNGDSKKRGRYEVSPGPTQKRPSILDRPPMGE